MGCKCCKNKKKKKKSKKKKEKKYKITIQEFIFEVLQMMKLYKRILYPTMSIKMEKMTNFKRNLKQN
jgi:hypothetical protein